MTITLHAFKHSVIIYLYTFISLKKKHIVLHAASYVSENDFFRLGTSGAYIGAYTNAYIIEVTV